jgi:hypothetical protein
MFTSWITFKFRKDVWQNKIHYYMFLFLIQVQKVQSDHQSETTTMTHQTMTTNQRPLRWHTKRWPPIRDHYDDTPNDDHQSETTTMTHQMMTTNQRPLWRHTNRWPPIRDHYDDTPNDDHQSETTMMTHQMMTTNQRPLWWHTKWRPLRWHTKWW